MFISLLAPAAAPSSRSGFFKSMADMIEVTRQRKQLAKLDDAALEDLGLTREEVTSEVNRDPWDLPR